MHKYKYRFFTSKVLFMQSVPAEIWIFMRRALNPMGFKETYKLMEVTN